MRAQNSSWTASLIQQQLVFVPLKLIEYGVYGHLLLIYAKPYSIYLRGTITIPKRHLTAFWGPTIRWMEQIFTPPKIPHLQKIPLLGDFWGVSQNQGTLSGGPHNKDYSILGSILGFHYFGILPYTYVIYACI